MLVTERMQVVRSLPQSWSALEDLFRAGSPPARPLDGRYSGQLLGLRIAPGFTHIGNLIAAAWMPWKGKWFDASHARGDNIFSRDSLAAARVMWPFYRGYMDDGPDTYRAFEFRTSIAPGMTDPDRQVLKIDYNLPGNPALSVRRVIDELVAVPGGLYLGKANLKWLWGRWQLVAFFTLSQRAE